MRTPTVLCAETLFATLLLWAACYGVVELLVTQLATDTQHMLMCVILGGLAAGVALFIHHVTIYSVL